MKDHQIDTSKTDSKKQSIVPLGISTRRVTHALVASNKLYSEMSLVMLVAYCTLELNRYNRGEPYAESYSIELMRRATVQGDQEARICMQLVFGGLVLNWIHNHPHRAEAGRLKNEEYYMSQAFERFWQAPSHQQMECSTLADMLYSLQMCLHGAILDSLRASDRSWDTPGHAPGEASESSLQDVTSSNHLWAMLQSLLVDKRELRLAYLLFNCGLKPREIVRSCQPEWSDLDEIYRLRHTILLRLHKQVTHLP